MEVLKAYKQWCNPFLRRMIGSGLTKMVVVLHQIGKDPDLSHVDRRWRASTLEPSGDHFITRSSSTCVVYDF